MDPLEQAFPFLEPGGRDVIRAQSREQTYGDGDVIVQEGVPVPALYVIVDGAVAVEKDFMGGAVPLAELGPGAIVGEVSFLDGSQASASVVARGDVTVQVIEDVDELLAANPGLAAGFYRSLAVLLAGRLRFGNEDRVVSALQWG